MEATRQNSSFCEHVEEPATDPLQSQNCEQSDVFAGLLNDLQIPEGSRTPVFVELCAGSAKLSDAVKQFGYKIVAVDLMTRIATLHAANWFSWICRINMRGTCWISYWKGF